MGTEVILTIGALGIVGIWGTIVLQCRRQRRFQEVENTFAVFLDFNREVSQQLKVLEENARQCYQSMDGDAMRLFYEAQKAVRYGQELERLGVQALSAGSAELLEEIQELFDLQRELDSQDSPSALAVEELTPRGYKMYATALIQKISEKVEVGIRNRNRVANVAAV